MHFPHPTNIPFGPSIDILTLFLFNDIIAPISEEFPKLSRSDFDTSPFQVPETAHFYQIHFMFSMLGLNHAFIIRNGNLVGVITKKDFLEKTRDQIMWQ